jgi:hypothetical protein
MGNIVFILFGPFLDLQFSSDFIFLGPLPLVNELNLLSRILQLLLVLRILGNTGLAEPDEHWVVLHPDLLWFMLYHNMVHQVRCLCVIPFIFWAHVTPDNVIVTPEIEMAPTATPRLFQVSVSRPFRHEPLSTVDTSLIHFILGAGAAVNSLKQFIQIFKVWLLFLSHSLSLLLLFRALLEMSKPHWDF